MWLLIYIWLYVIFGFFVLGFVVNGNFVGMAVVEVGIIELEEILEIVLVILVNMRLIFMY